MAALTEAPKFYEVDANGDPLALGKVYTYLTNTNTPKATYTNSGAGTPNTNPVILDSAGRANIWLNTDALYRFEVYDQDDALIYGPIDSIGASVSYPALSASSGSSLISFLQAGSGAVARTVQSKLRDTVSVLDFGATGNGTTDDAAAFANAAARGLPLRVPAGTYRIGSQVTFPAGSYLIGDGIENTIIAADDDVSPFLWTEASLSDINGGGISGMTIKGNGAAVKLVTVNNIWGFHAFACRIYGETSVFRGIEIQRQSFECKIDSCRITDVAEACIYLNEISGAIPNGCMIVNCDLNNEDGGYGIYDEGSNTKILGNWFECTAPAGATAVVYSTGSPKITNNNFSGSTDGSYVIQLVATTGAQVLGNSIAVTGGAGVYTTGSYGSISNNTFAIDYATDVITVSGGADNIVTDNTVKLITGADYALTNVINITGSAVGVNVCNNVASFTGGSGGAGIGVTVENGCNAVKLIGNTIIGITKAFDINSNATSTRVHLIGNSSLSCAADYDILNQADVMSADNVGEATTWTPAVRGSGTAGTYELATAVGRVVRNGKSVTVHFDIVFAAMVTGGGTSALNITGLPFEKASGVTCLGSVITDGVDYTGDQIVLGFLTTSASSTLGIYQVVDDSSFSALPISGVAANDQISGSITYQIA